MAEDGAGYSEIMLEPKLASRAAPALFAQLNEQRGNTIVLNASGVEQIGVLCMQILVSAAKTWSEADKTFEVVEPSEIFMNSAKALGLDPALMGVGASEETTGGA